MGTFWTAEQLARLRQANRSSGGNLAAAAAMVGASPAECDRALFALLGRTPQQAEDALIDGRHLEAAS